MMKITGLSHLFKWENFYNWWLTKYYFAPLYIENKEEKTPLQISKGGVATLLRRIVGGNV